MTDIIPTATQDNPEIKPEVDLYLFDATLLTEEQMDEMAARLARLCGKALNETPRLGGEEGNYCFFRNNRDAHIGTGYLDEFGALLVGDKKYVAITPTLLAMLTPEQKQEIANVYLEYKQKTDALSANTPAESPATKAPAGIRNAITKVLASGRSLFQRDHDGPGLSL